MRIDIKKAMRLTGVVASLLLTVLTAHAQQLDWVKTYSGQEPIGYYWNYIIGSVADSHGNLYVGGGFARGASVDGEDLLPFAPHGGDVENPNVCIMKISPQGEVVWKKVLHGNYGQPTRIYDLQLVGDTALYANVTITLPRENDREYLYFYDTLYTKANLEGLLCMDSIASGCITTAISVFDLDGNLTENYVLHTAYKDKDGRLITLDRQSRNEEEAVYIANQQFKPGKMHVDSRGNIYFGHLATDMITLWCDTCEYGMQRCDFSNGLLSETVVMVNGRQRFFVAPASRPTTYNFRIFKFAPHFEELLGCRYVFEEEGCDWTRWSYSGFELTTDREGNAFLLCNIESDVRNVPLSGDTTIVAHLNNYLEGMVIKYDEDLNPTGIIQLNMKSNEQGVSRTRNCFSRCIFEPDSNSIIILGSFARNHDGCGRPILYGEDSLHIRDDCAYFFRIDNPTGRLQSYGFIPSSTETTFLTYQHTLNSIAKDNRIFTHVGYRGDIELGDSTVAIATNNYGDGLYICDYDGNYINYIDYGEPGGSIFEASSLALHDSVLYITGGSINGLRLNNNTLLPTGNSIAFMARYVDSSFMAPYSPGGGETLIEGVELGEVGLYPNPTRSLVTVVLPAGETVRECLVFSANGTCNKERITSNTLDMSKYAAGIYHIRIITNHHIFNQKIIKL